MNASNDCAWDELGDADPLIFDEDCEAEPAYFELLPRSRPTRESNGEDNLREAINATDTPAAAAARSGRP